MYACRKVGCGLELDHKGLSVRSVCMDRFEDGRLHFQMKDLTFHHGHLMVQKLRAKLVKGHAHRL